MSILYHLLFTKHVTNKSLIWPRDKTNGVLLDVDAITRHCPSVALKSQPDTLHCHAVLQRSMVISVIFSYRFLRRCSVFCMSQTAMFSMWGSESAIGQLHKPRLDLHSTMHAPYRLRKLFATWPALRFELCMAERVSSHNCQWWIAQQKAWLWRLLSLTGQLPSLTRRLVFQAKGIFHRSRHCVYSICI